MPNLTWPASVKFRGIQLVREEFGEKELRIPGLMEEKFESGQRRLVPAVGPVCPFCVYRLVYEKQLTGLLTAYLDSSILRCTVEIKKEAAWFKKANFKNLENVSPFYEWFVSQVKGSVEGYQFRIMGTSYCHAKYPPWVFTTL